MVDSNPEKLVEELKANRENPEFFSSFLTIFMTSKTRALKAESVSWINSLSLEQLSPLVCPVFAAAFEEIDDLLAQQLKMVQISRLLTIKRIKEVELNTGSVETWIMAFLEKYLNTTLTDFNAFEAAIRPVVNVVQMFSLKFSQSNIDRILEYMGEFSLQYKDIATQLALIVALHSPDIVGESVARLALILAHMVYATLPQDKDYGTEIADLCQNIDNSVKHYAMQVLIVYINKQTVQEALVDKVFTMLCAFWEFPIQSIVGMCHKIFEALLPLLTLTKIEELCVYVKQIRSKHKFLVLKTISRAKGAGFILERFPEIVGECSRASLSMNTKPAALELLQTLFTWHFAEPQSDWTQLWSPLLSETYSLAEVLPIVVKIDSGKYSMAKILASQLTEHNLVTAIGLARKYDILKYSADGISVGDVEISNSKLKSMLGSVDLELSSRTLQILSITKRTTESLNTVEKSLLLYFAKKCLKSSNQDFHHHVITYIGHILTRLRISKDTEKTAFARQFHDVLLKHIRRSASYELLFPALSILRQLYCLFGTAEGNENPGFFHKKIGKIEPLGEDFAVEASYVDLLIDCSYDKLRKLVYDILRILNPSRVQVDVTAMLELAGSPRTKESDAAAYLLRLCPTFSDIDFVIQEIRSRCENFTPLPHGLIFQIRLTLLTLPFSAPLALKLIDLMTHVSEKTCELLSRFDLAQDQLDCRGHVSDSEDHTVMGIWLACKENGFLLQAFSKWVVISSEMVAPLGEMAQRIYQVLNSLKHRGAIEKTSGGLSALCACLMTHEETQATPDSILTTLFQIILSSENKNNILRRSAGIPYVLICTLKSPQLVKKAMNFLVENALGSIESVKIHCLNIMRHLFTSSDVKKELEIWLGPCLEASMKAFSSSEWSVRNSGMMAFSAIMIRILGQSQNKISMGVLKSRSPDIEEFLVTNLTKVEDPLPFLLLISKMQIEISSELFASIASLLGHSHVMIRQKAARSLEALGTAEITAVSESGLEMTVGGHSLSVTRDSRNLLHGALLLLGYLEKVSGAQQLAQLTSYEAVQQAGYVTQAFYKACTKYAVDLDSSPPSSADSHRVKPDIANSLGRIEMIKYQFSKNASLSLAKATLGVSEGQIIMDDPEILEVVASEIISHLSEFEGKQELGEFVVQMLEAVANTRTFGYAVSKLLKLAFKLEVELSSDLLAKILANFRSASRVRSSIIQCSSHWSAFPELVFEFSQPEEKDYVRRSCAQALQNYNPTTESSAVLLRTLLVFLEDVNEDIRQIAATTASQTLQLGTAQNSEICYVKLWELIGQTLPQAALADFLKPYLDSYVTFGDYIQSSENKNKIFYKESENQFQDRLREKRCISSVLAKYSDEKDKFMSILGAVDKQALEVDEVADLEETIKVFSEGS